jgi:hypothetical protein
MPRAGPRLFPSGAAVEGVKAQCQALTASVRRREQPPTDHLGLQRLHLSRPIPFAITPLARKRYLVFSVIVLTQEPQRLTRRRRPTVKDCL